MVNLDLLHMGRKFGHENLVELQNLKRGLKRNPSGTFNAHIETDSKALNAYYEAVKNRGLLDAAMVNKTFNMAKELSPRTYGETAKTTTDIVVDKLSETTGKLSVKSVAKDAEGEFGRMEFNAANTDSKIAIRAKAEAENMKMDYDIVMENPVLSHKGMDKDSVAKIAKAINLEEKDGLSKFNIAVDNAGLFEKVDMKLQAPTRFLDAISGVQHGEGVTFRSQIDSVKAFINK